MGETPVDSRLSLNSHVCRILQKTDTISRSETVKQIIRIRDF